jgi:hypothetical protein
MIAGEGGVGGGWGAFSRDRCGRAATGRVILGITISHFASGPDVADSGDFKACCDKAWFGFVVTTSIVVATGATGFGAGGTGTGRAEDLGVAGAWLAGAAVPLMYAHVTGKRNVAP